MTLMWHPVTDQTFEAPDSAVPQYLQSGWLPATERAEHERRATERAEAAVQEAAQQETPTQASGGRGGKSKAASSEEA